MVAVMPSLVERSIQRRFSRSHAHHGEVLIARGALAEPAVVGNIDQHFGAAGRKLAHEFGSTDS